MNSSKSQQHSHPSSSSSSPDPSSQSGFNDSGSGSGFNGSGSGSGSGFNGSGSGFDGSGSNSRTLSGSGGSAGETSPSAAEGDENSGSSMKSKSTSTGYESEVEEEDMDIDITGSCQPTKVEPESSTHGKGKGKIVLDTASSCREGKAEEIGLLTDLYTLYNKTGRYLMSASNDQRDFYKFWIKEEGDYANGEELDNKIIELHARFLKNMDKDVEGPTDPIDVEILRLSYWIWGDEIDSCEQTAADDDVTDQSLEETADADDQELAKDSSDVNMADDEGVNPNEKYGDETADARHGVDHIDSTKESGQIGKDSSSKAN